MSELGLDISRFEEFQKIARLSRGCVITEKIDGTNAQVYIAEPGTMVPTEHVLAEDPIGCLMLAGSRSRYIVPGKIDNFGFAAWVKANAEALWDLGPGRHYGEWWGSGIQRGYGLTGGEKRWSLFNVARWSDDRDRETFPGDRPACCYVVPVLYRGLFTTSAVQASLDALEAFGSKAAPGFVKVPGGAKGPEGVVVWHEAARILFKQTLEKDEEWKGKPAE